MASTGSERLSNLETSGLRGSSSTISRPSSYLDWFYIALGICLTFGICFRLTAGKLLGEDEMLGWMLLHDASWQHMIFSWKHGADGGGSLFYLTGRVWFKIFGATQLSFRLYSASCFALAFAIIWKAARRFYPVRTVAFAVATTWFFSSVLIQHMAEGRFYGLFMAAAAAVTYIIIASAEERRSGRLVIATIFVANSALVTSHILGIAYSGCLLVAMMLIDRLHHVRRPWLYLATIASWLWLIPSREAIVASALVGKPHFWIVQPNLSGLLLMYGGGSRRTIILLTALVTVAVVRILFSRRRAELVSTIHERMPILIVASAYLSVPILFYIKGFFGTPLCTGRYMQPVEIGIFFLMAEVTYQMDSGWSRMRRYRAIAMAAAFFCVLAVVLHYDLLPTRSLQRKDYTAALTRSLPVNVPVICEDAYTFPELMSEESSSAVKYMYLLDWQYAVSLSAPKIEVSEYHLMDNWKKVGYFSDRIAYRSSFLASHPYFLVLHSKEDHDQKDQPKSIMIGNPLAARFASDPAYQELPFSVVDLDNLHEQTSLVCQRSLECSEIMIQLKNQVGKQNATHQDPTMHSLPD